MRLLSALVLGTMLAAAVCTPVMPAVAAEVSKQATQGDGYFFVATDGGIFNFGGSEFKGSTGDTRLNQPIVGAETTPTGEGYWLVASDGGIFTFGDANFLGSTGDIKLNKPIVAMVATPTGNGYWLFATDGGVFTFGDAVFYGSTGDIALNQPIVGADATASGKGYYLVAADGGIFTFGDAEFYGSAGSIRLNKPIVGMAATDDGDGYYLVATDGGIFSYGKTADDAQFFGSTGDLKLNQPIVGMDLTSSNRGYYLVAADGGIFSFGDAAFYGSTGNLVLNKPIVGISVTSSLSGHFVARVSGAKETGGETYVSQDPDGGWTEKRRPGGGDADASGVVALDVVGGELCYDIKVSGLDGQATAAHIQRGNAGVSGPVVATLKPPNADGSSVGCVELDSAMEREIIGNPHGFYVNIPNGEFPRGAVRGQLKGHTAVGVQAVNAERANLVTFDTEDPSSVAVLGEIALHIPPQGGYDSDRWVEAIDFRPGTRDLYLLVRTGRTSTPETYWIPTSMTLQLVKADLAGNSTTIGEPFPVKVGGEERHDGQNYPYVSAFGFDFDPLTHEIRVLSDIGEHFRLNPDSGEKLPASPLPPGFNEQGAGPPHSGVAYTYDPSGESTTVFTIRYSRFVLSGAGGTGGGGSCDTSTGGGTGAYWKPCPADLLRLGGVGGTPSPNDGTSTRIGSLGEKLTADFGFDIAPGAPGTAFVVGDVHEVGNVLLALDLETGDATRIGPTGRTGITSFAILS